jgi:hypothetical protein
LTACRNKGKLLDAWTIRTPHFCRIWMAATTRKGEA